MATKIVGGFCFPQSEEHFAKLGDDVINYQKGQRDYAMTFVKDRRLAIDLGANVGLFSHDFARHFDKVMAFEPCALNFECLEQNVPANVECLRFAVRDEPGHVQLVTTPLNCGGNFIEDIPEGLENGSVETVEVKRLDDFDIPFLGLLKIDIQGYEEAALKGAIETLRRTRPVVLIEEKSMDRSKDQIYACRRILRNQLGMVAKDKVGADRVYIFED